LGSFVLFDNAPLDFIDRQRRAPLVFSQQLEVALSIVPRA
jgi:hypothetical protein